MSVSVSRAGSFDVRNHIRRAAILHILIDIFGMVVCPLTLLLSTEGDARLWVVKIAVGVVVPIMALWDMIRSIGHLRNPYNHSALQWTEHGAPGALVAELEREMSASDQHLSVGKVTLTPSWLVRATPFVLIAVPYSQIAWAFKKITKRRAFYGVIPVGKDFSLSLNTRNGKTQLFANIPEAQVDSLLSEIAPRAPWAIVGFDAQAQQAWEKRRGEFLQTVDARAAWVRQVAAARESGNPTEFDLGGAASPMGPHNPW